MVVWVVGALAFAMRLWSVLHSGGFDAVLGYDEGVYFGASTGFVNGLMPYRDFVLVHPPGVLLLLSPFAALARVIGDPHAWMLARLFVMSVGAANAMMLVIIGRRAGRWTGAIAGLLYAVWMPAIHVERTTMLEAFVLAGMLLALVLIRSPQEIALRVAFAGGALGMAMSVKLWGAVPLAVVVGWLLLSRAWRSALIVGIAATAVAALIVGPFAMVAPSRMLDLVVLAQVNRAQGGTGRVDRLPRILGLANVDPRYSVHVPAVAVAVIVALLAFVCVLAWRRPAARLWVALLLVQLGVLLAVPVYFAGYSSFAAPALVLVLGAAIETVRVRVTERDGAAAQYARIVLAAGVAVVIVASAVGSTLEGTRDFENPGALVALTRGFRCIASDSASMLIVANVLSRDLERGCPVVFDVDGSVYAMDAGANPGELSSHDRRRTSTDYQDTLARYFASGDAVILHRRSADGIDAPLVDVLAARPLLWKRGSNELRGPAAAAPDD